MLVILMTVGRVAAQNLQTVSYNDGTQRLNGLVTSNAGKKLPGVLILPAWMGIDEEARTAALELEKQGYVAFVADIYGEGNVPADIKAAGAIAGTFKQDYALYQRRIRLAMEALINAGADPERIAVIGYCFGGTGALEAVRADLHIRGAVSIHGGLAKDPARPNQPVNTHVLILHGASDPYVSDAEVQQVRNELDAGKADWQLVMYAGCKHTFTNPASPDYNAVMAARAWQQTLLFLKEVLTGV